MTKYLFLAIAALYCFAQPTQATPLVADLSNYRIDVDSSFNGTRIFLFGNRNTSGDIVVALRGPLKNYIVRKKEPVAGIWVNRERMKFFNVPDFYVLASNKPLEDIGPPDLFRQLLISKENLLSPPGGAYDPASYQDFSQALIHYQEQRRLYNADMVPVSFMAETLFKTAVDFPDNIPPGSYTAEIFLISDGKVLGMQSTPIVVKKTGVDAFVYEYAHNHPLLYGFTAVLLALTAGWFGGRFFGKT